MMMKKLLLILLLIGVFPVTAQAQVTINATASPPNCLNTGAIKITATGLPSSVTYGVAKEPFSAANIISSTSPEFSLLEPGAYFYGYFSGTTFIKSVSTVTVTVKPRATAANILGPNDYEVCIGRSATYAARPIDMGEKNLIFNWYSDAALTNLLGTGAVFVVNNSVAATYYITMQSDNFCENLPGTAKAFTVTVAPTAPAGAITAMGATICAGESVRLRSTSSIPLPSTTKWYSGNIVGSSLVGNGSSITVTPTETTTYYVGISGVGFCETKPADRTPVTVTVKPRATAADILVNSMNVCVGESATFTATSTTVTNPVFKWYRSTGATTFTELATGPTFTPQASDYSGVGEVVYYVSVSGDEKCENEMAISKMKKVSLVVKPGATDVDISVNSMNVCVGESATFTATSTTVTNPVFKWYRSTGATTFTQLAAGSTFTPQASDYSGVGEVVYYVSVSGNEKCENELVISKMKKVSLVMKPRATATDITASNITICHGEIVRLTVTTALSNPVFNWYSNAVSTTAMATGSSYNVNPTVTTTYYVAVSGDNTCENTASTRKEITVTVKPRATAADILVNSMNVCVGESATFTATSTTITNPVFKWYRSIGAATFAELATGPTFTPQASDYLGEGEVVYYVSVSGDEKCENEAFIPKMKEVRLIVKRGATALEINASNQLICIGETATIPIYAPGIVGSSSFIKIYSDESLTNLLYTTPFTTAGFDYVTPILSGTTKYYVTVLNDIICENRVGSAKVVEVKVKPRAIATDITASNVTICHGDTARLTATTALSNPVFNWYSNAVSTTAMVTGSSYNVSPTVTTTYYVAVSGDNTCENTASTRKEITVIVNPKATEGTITVTAVRL